jgi:predicted RNase H-like nuclease (RuvC/YqgF family)
MKNYKILITIILLSTFTNTIAQVKKVKTESIQDLSTQIIQLKNEVEYLKQSIINLDNNYKNIIYENNKNYDRINNAIIFLGQDINKLFKGYNNEMPSNNPKSQLNTNIQSQNTTENKVKSSGQCSATTQKGTRCSRTSRSNGYCWQHGG